MFRRLVRLVVARVPFPTSVRQKESPPIKNPQPYEIAESEEIETQKLDSK